MKAERVQDRLLKLAESTRKYSVWLCKLIEGVAFVVGAVTELFDSAGDD